MRPKCFFLSLISLSLFNFVFLFLSRSLEPKTQQSLVEPNAANEKEAPSRYSFIRVSVYSIHPLCIVRNQYYYYY